MWALCIYQRAFLNQPRNRICDDLRRLGISLLYGQEELLNYEYVAVFDTESILHPAVDELAAANALKLEKIRFYHNHQVSMIAVTSNVTRQLRIFTIDPDKQHRFLFDFVRHLNELSQQAQDLMLLKCAPIIDTINEQMRRGNADVTAKMERALKLIHNYTRQMPVIGVNSGSYDMNTMRTSGFFSILYQLNVDNEGRRQQLQIVKKGSTYMLVASRRLRFVDLFLYISKISYRNLCINFLGIDEKGKN